LILSVAVSD
jgi:hypothetical protein